MIVFTISKHITTIEEIYSFIISVLSKIFNEECQKENKSETCPTLTHSEGEYGLIETTHTDEE